MKKLNAGLALTTAASAILMTALAVPASAAAVSAVPVSGIALQDRDDWHAPPPELDEVMRQGFHDGVEGARKDFENHRRPEVNNREEFRHPRVRHRDREAYRRGFERGYQRGVEHLYHDRR